ncbi:MAG: lipid-binding SYLF domain-containing protein [Rhodospirillales bacterium]|nr:lipid-binding SYLF domain-containing protein [Alphaproteobacteria bacterium]MBL6948342.1 lipid-binding SYLF domain-containing protein [Rhodospirillales bacterium]
MKRLVSLVLAVFLVSSCQQMTETPGEGVDRLLQWSADTVENFSRKPELKNFSSYISKARAVLVLPAIVKAGFFIGAEGGTGVLLARDASGAWGYPAFYTLGAASFGLQFGVQDTETVLVIRNDGALQAIIKDQGKFGADLGITAGIYGTGMEASTTSNLRLDVLAFTNAKVGAFAGASLEGAVLARRNDLNEALYGQGVTPGAIINEGRHKTPRADRLRTLLARF